MTAVYWPTAHGVGGGGGGGRTRWADSTRTRAFTASEMDKKVEVRDHAKVRADPSLRAVDDLLRVLDRGLVRRFVFLQDVDGLLCRGDGFVVVPELRLNLRLLVVHEVSVWVLFQRLVDPLCRLVHSLLLS